MLQVRSRSTAGWPEWLVTFYNQKPATLYDLGTVYFSTTPVQVICHNHAVGGFMDSLNKRYRYFGPNSLYGNVKSDRIISDAISTMRVKARKGIPVSTQKEALIKLIKNKGQPAEFYWNWEGVPRPVPAILQYKNGKYKITILTINKEYN